MSAYAGAYVRLSYEQRAWYIDRFGMERECVAITMSGMGAENTILAVVGLDGQKLDVDHKDVYFVPQRATDD